MADGTPDRTTGRAAGTPDLSLDPPAGTPDATADDLDLDVDTTAAGTPDRHVDVD